MSKRAQHREKPSLQMTGKHTGHCCFQVCLTRKLGEKSGFGCGISRCELFNTGMKKIHTTVLWSCKENHLNLIHRYEGVEHSDIREFSVLYCGEKNRRIWLELREITVKTNRVKQHKKSVVIN
jgi:hypothetical protein